jgi:hypothetical protein
MSYIKDTKFIITTSILDISANYSSSPPSGCPETMICSVLNPVKTPTCTSAKPTIFYRLNNMKSTQEEEQSTIRRSPLVSTGEGRRSSSNACKWNCNSSHKSHIAHPLLQGSLIDEVSDAYIGRKILDEYPDLSTAPK